MVSTHPEKGCLHPLLYPTDLSLLTTRSHQALPDDLNQGAAKKWQCVEHLVEVQSRSSPIMLFVPLE